MTNFNPHNRYASAAASAAIGLVGGTVKNTINIGGALFGALGMYKTESVINGCAAILGGSFGVAAAVPFSILGGAADTLRSASKGAIHYLDNTKGSQLTHEQKVQKYGTYIDMREAAIFLATGFDPQKGCDLTATLRNLIN